MVEGIVGRGVCIGCSRTRVYQSGFEPDFWVLGTASISYRRTGLDDRTGRRWVSLGCAPVALLMSGQAQPRGQSMIEVLILAAGLIMVLGLSSGPLSGLVRAIALNYSGFVEALSLP